MMIILIHLVINENNLVENKDNTFDEVLKAQGRIVMVLNQTNHLSEKARSFLIGGELDDYNNYWTEIKGSKNSFGTFDLISDNHYSINAAFEKVEIGINSLRQIESSAFEEYFNGRKEKAFRMLTDERYMSAKIGLGTSITELQIKIRAAWAFNLRMINQQISSNIFLLRICVLFTAVVLFVFIFLLFNKAKGIKLFKERLKTLAKGDGDLTALKKITGSGDIKKISEYLYEFLNKLTTIIKNAQNSIVQISS